MNTNVRSGDMTRFDIPESELRWRFDTPGGPGGQHANKTSSRAELRFDVSASRAFDRPTRDRIVSRLGTEVKIVEQGSRSQVANRREAIARLHVVIEDAARPDPRQRRATRPSRSARARRVSEKRARSATKRNRRTPGVED
jgi:ribosome-associated protein